jgi:hypothetical protein
MQDTASVLRDRGFVQMAEGVPVKFKSSVARRMHLRLRVSQTGTLTRPGTLLPRPVKPVFAVDRG